MQDQSFLFAALQRGLSVSSSSVWEECGHMTNCGSCRRIGTILVVVMSLLSLLVDCDKVSRRSNTHQLSFGYLEASWEC
jgi:hypothetical protein